MNTLGVKTLDYGAIFYQDYYDDYETAGISDSFFGRLSMTAQFVFSEDSSYDVYFEAT